MTEDELIRKIQLKQQLSELDGSRVSEYDPSDGMETVEDLKKYIRFLYELNQEKDKRILQMESDMSDIKAELKEANRRADEEAIERKKVFDRLERFMDEQKAAADEVKVLKRKLETAENRLALANAALYNGSKTCSDKYSGQKNEGINDGRDDFDGTRDSLPANTPGPVGSDCDKFSSEGKSDKVPSSTDGHDSDNIQEETQSCYHGPSRKGWTYVKEQVGDPIEHKCVVPEGCRIVKVYKKPRIIKTIVQRLEEHHFQKIRVEYADGTRETITAPADEEGKEILEELVPGTGITATLLSFMIFNRYIMASPAYREAKIKSLQSDGYNVYMYLDDEMVNIEHICCLAHVHNKLQEAKKLGYKIVDFFLAEIKKLYKREKYYANHPEIFKTPAMIKDARNDEYTDGIVNGMHKKLLDLIAKGEEYFPDKVWRALKYFHSFWDQIFAYRHDGEYSIDNMAVERAIRPLTVQRKNALFFCSPKGARNSGIYNTFISTCQQKCRNFRDFFVDYVKAWNQGRRDFGNLVRLVYAPCTL